MIEYLDSLQPTPLAIAGICAAVVVAALAMVYVAILFEHALHRFNNPAPKIERKSK